MPSVTTFGSFRPKIAEQLLWDEQEERADDRRHADADTRGDLHATHRALRMAGAEILPGDGGRSAHQAHRGPGDQREELGVADRIGRLRLGAVRQRSDEAQQHDAGDVHRHALNARGQTKLEQRPDDLQVRRRDIVLGKWTTRRPLSSSQMPIDETIRLADAVPIAAPRVPNAGTGP